MADEIAPGTKPGGKNDGEKTTKDEVALELMKFIAQSTGYGKGTPGAGFVGKGASRSPEEYADSLIELFLRCRTAVVQPLPGEK